MKICTFYEYVRRQVANLEEATSVGLSYGISEELSIERERKRASVKPE
jgi:hypothetical protein